MSEPGIEPTPPAEPGEPPLPPEDPGPIQTQPYQVRCSTCAALAYADTVPPTSQAAVLTAFADAQCPRGGDQGGCPNTTAAVAAREALRPTANRMRIGAVTALTDTRAVVAVDQDTVNAARVAGADLTVGDTVAVQQASPQWVVIGRVTP